MHQKPDGDAMGATLPSIIFMKGLGHETTVISPTNWANSDWMPGIGQVMDFDKRKKGITVDKSGNRYFCLDFNVLHRTEYGATLTDAVCTKILIDHHRETREEAFTYGISDTSKALPARWYMILL